MTSRPRSFTAMEPSVGGPLNIPPRQQDISLDAQERFAQTSKASATGKGEQPFLTTLTSIPDLTSTGGDVHPQQPQMEGFPSPPNTFPIITSSPPMTSNAMQINNLGERISTMSPPQQHSLLPRQQPPPHNVAVPETAYYLARIHELEETLERKQVQLENCIARERSLQTTVEGFKKLAQRHQSMQKENAAHHLQLEDQILELTAKLDALLSENDGLRAQLQQGELMLSQLMKKRGGRNMQSPRRIEEASSLGGGDSNDQQSFQGGGKVASSENGTEAAGGLVSVKDERIRELEFLLEQRSNALNEAYEIIAKSSTGLNSQARKALMMQQQRSLTAGGATPTLMGGSAPYKASNKAVSFTEQGPSWFARQNAMLSLRITELEHELQRTRKYLKYDF